MTADELQKLRVTWGDRHMGSGPIIIKLLDHIQDLEDQITKLDPNLERSED